MYAPVWCALRILIVVFVAAVEGMPPPWSGTALAAVQSDTTPADGGEVSWMVMSPIHSSRDQDEHKGATDDDRPDLTGPNTPGLDDNGLPNDATLIAQDALGAVEDRSQG